MSISHPEPRATTVPSTADVEPLHKGPVDRLVLTLPIVGAMVYPLLILAVARVAHIYHSSSRPQVSVGSFAIASVTALALAVSGSALVALLLIAKSKRIFAVGIRRMLHMAYAAPPLLLLSSYSGRILGQNGWLALWGTVWAVAIVVAWRSSVSISAPTPNRQPPNRPRFPRLPERFQIVHRYAAASLAFGFLAVHLGNHLMALWSDSAQQAGMNMFRNWYRAHWIEPVIIGLFAILCLSGLPLALRYTRLPADKFRTLQTAAGGYLAFFIVNHILAVLRARTAGIDTGWAFATGGSAGILSSELHCAVFIYYVVALFSVGVHVAVGIRMVLLGQRVGKPAADRVAHWLLGFGSAGTVLITAALLGIRFGH